MDEMGTEVLLPECHIFTLIDGRMYVFDGGDELLVIDPFEDPALAGEAYTARIRHVTILLTHEHFDHISGINYLRSLYPCTVIAGERCRQILSSKNNGTSRFPFLFLTDREKFDLVREKYHFPYECTVDRGFEGETTLSWKGHTLLCREVSGHSPGSITILFDEHILFAGDNLLGNGQELKNVGAEPAAFREMIRGFARHLTAGGEDYLVCPGHGETGHLSDFLRMIAQYEKE